MRIDLRKNQPFPSYVVPNIDGQKYYFKGLFIV